MYFMEKLTENQKKELSAFIQVYQHTSEEIKRAQAILMVSENMAEPMLMAFTGLKRATAVKLRKQYLKLGLQAIESKRKEKKYRALLTKRERAEIAEMLNTQTPRDYGWEWDYWTPTILGHVILEKHAVKYKSKTSIRLLFKEAKFTYHKPEKRYERRDQAKIDAWKAENYEKVQQMLQDPEVVILTADEMILSTQTTTQKVWLPAGTIPKIECSVTRKNKSIYGFLNIKTGQQHAFKAERQTGAITVEILKKVVKIYENKKIKLFWDSAPWHRSIEIREFLTKCEQSKKIDLELIAFPTYAPEENPQEHVWKIGRAQVTHNRFITDIESITREFLSYLNNTIFEYEFFGFTARQ